MWGLGLVGLAGTVLAFAVESSVGFLGIDWPWIEASEVAVVQSVLTNFGTGFILATVVLALEPRIKRAVKRTVRTVAREELQESLADAVEQISREAKESVRRQDETIAAAANRFDYETVFNLMSDALDSDALVDGQITVQGTDVLGEFVVTLACHEPPVNRMEVQPEDLSRRLRIMVETTSGSAFTETWLPDEPFSQTVSRLHKGLNRVKAWGLNQDRPWKMAMERLISAIGLALRSQSRASDGILLKGSLGEVIADGWYITDAGLECPGQDYCLPRSEFPVLGRPRTQGSLRQDSPSPKDELDELIQKRPEWADQAIWSYALKRCRARFSRRQDILGNLIEDVIVPHEQLGRPLP